ncbi:MAG TPA: ferritin [Opitutae bacterium]|nr:ferritin [Opitutae bacterium]
MQLSPKVERVLNDQINHELTAFYAYMAMAAWFEQTPYKGFSTWMQAQSKEELTHADKIFHYISERNGSIKLKEIPLDAYSFKTPLSVFEAALILEESTTAAIHDVYELSLKEKDFETQNFLNWFLKEQIEEESSVRDMIDKLKLSNGSPSALMHLDSVAGKRPL